MAPFLFFIGCMAAGQAAGLSPLYAYPLRTVAGAAAIWIWSRRVVSLRAAHLAGSVLMGIAIFLVWIGPDLLVPGYRTHWLFNNPLVGKLGSSIPLEDRANWLFLIVRVLGSVVVVPIAEELFWRAWMSRRLLSERFQALPLGTYSLSGFLISAACFGLEHGVYWEVGIAAGLLFNFWLRRTRSLGACILAHAVTNGILAAYVLRFGQWQYW